MSLITALTGLTRDIAARMVGKGIELFAKAITAVRAEWRGIEPVAQQRIYFANHTSNADLPMIWSVLPPALRRQTRPVAAADYWLTSPLRAFAGRDVFRAVLIDRRPEARTENPVGQMVAALDEGSSLTIFPEGKRNMGPHPLEPFKTGIYHMAVARPGVDLVPVWIANLNAIMPKGEVIPLPLICSVIFGAPIRIAPDEGKEAFLARATAALLALKPEERR
jgi:1-acyl-sn-glycerol-3-phosphate acyltransferase